MRQKQAEGMVANDLYALLAIRRDLEADVHLALAKKEGAATAGAGKK